MSDTDYQANLEPGLLTRVRSYRDLFPWLALGDAIRPPTSVISTLLSVAALWLVAGGFWAIDRMLPADSHTSNFTTHVRIVPSDHESRLIDLPVPARLSLPSCALYLNGQLTDAVVHAESTRQFINRCIKQIWLWCVWVIPAGYVMRRTVLTVAGRPPMASVDVIRLIRSRAISFLGAPTIVLFAVGIVAAIYWVVRLLTAVPALGTLLGIVLFPLAISAGLLLGGLIVGIGLIWAAIVTEEYADSFDVVSRGFEYLFQRPLKTALYVVMATVVSSIMTWIVSAIMLLALSIACGLSPVRDLSAATIPYGLPLLADTIVHAYAMNLFFALTAVIYLLLRRDANHREIEEVWQPPSLQKPLPELKLDEHGVPQPPQG